MPKTMEEKKVWKIRRSIRRTKELLKNGEIKLLDEETVRKTNCYAYSLGIMYHGEGADFDIGFTNHTLDKLVDPKEIIDKICTDLENLRFKFRKINLMDDKVLRKNEYLVKVFYAEPNEYDPEGDFHFMRQDRKSGKWFHKMGWYYQPEFVESNSEEQFYFNNSGEPMSFTTWEFSYKPLTYFAITEK